MLSGHEERAREYRALAAHCRAEALASLLPQVQEGQVRAAERWDRLADFEDLYARGADRRRDLYARGADRRRGPEPAADA